MPEPQAGRLARAIAAGTAAVEALRLPDGKLEMNDARNDRAFVLAAAKVLLEPWDAATITVGEHDERVIPAAYDRALAWRLVELQAEGEDRG